MRRRRGVVRLLGVYTSREWHGVFRGAARVSVVRDTDYDGRTFCVCQAFFPDRSAW